VTGDVMSAMSFDGLIHRRFDAVARQVRERVALQAATDTTFGQLLDGSDRIAAQLVELGCAPPDRIAIVASDHAVVVTAMLGVLKAGCAFAPIDPITAGPRLPGLLARLACRVVIDDRGLSIATTRPPPSASDPDAMCSIYFTSGSTGAPRAIAGRLSGIDHHIAWELGFLGLDASVRGAIIHPISYDAYLPDVFVPLCAGGTACAPSGLDPERLCGWLEREQITLLHCVPSLFRSLLAVPGASRLAHLRDVLLAGEVVHPADVLTARAVLGDRVRLVNLYGPSEATLVKLHHVITDADLAGPIPIGRPMPEVEVAIRDDGEIAIRSRHGALGYLDEPELTRARFLPDGTYLTGDHGSVLPDGAIAFHGRRDRQIKLLGARVDLDEVEAILRSCDGVVEAAVVVAETALHGYVVLAPGMEIARVRTAAMGRLAPAMRLAWLTEVAQLPRTATGKLDRRQLTDFEDHPA